MTETPDETVLKQSKNLWYYVGVLPLVLMAICVAGLAVAYWTGSIHGATFKIAAFSLAELCMVVAGAGGISYLINPEKTAEAKCWVWVNVVLFFFCAFGGAVLFVGI